ncbi:MAG: TPR repeat protein [Polyangiales bacterium]|jgi:TPR repeat protein
MENDEELLRDMKRSSRGLLQFSLLFAVVPFVFNFVANELDYVKIGAGGLACVLGLVAIIRAFKGEHRARNIGLSLVAMVLGLFHVATSGVLGVDPFGTNEAGAREWLEGGGDEILALEQAAERFSYTVIHEGQRCSGSLVINTSFSGTNTSNVETCGASATDDEYRRECASGRAPSCQDLGIRLSESNPSEALVYFRQGCEGGVGGACSNAGVALQRTGSVEEALSMSERGCTMGDSMGCANAGTFLLQGSSNVSEEVVTRATGYLDGACAAGVFLACGNLAWKLSFGSALPRDEVRGRALFASACDEGIFTSCADLAVLFRDGGGGPVDGAQALRYASRACEGGQPSRSSVTRAS